MGGILSRQIQTSSKSRGSIARAALSLRAFCLPIPLLPFSISEICLAGMPVFSASCSWLRPSLNLAPARLAAGRFTSPFMRISRQGAESRTGSNSSLSLRAFPAIKNSRSMRLLMHYSMAQSQAHWHQQGQPPLLAAPDCARQRKTGIFCRRGKKILLFAEKTLARVKGSVYLSCHAICGRVQRTAADAITGAEP